MKKVDMDHLRDRQGSVHKLREAFEGGGGGVASHVGEGVSANIT